MKVLLFLNGFEGCQSGIEDGFNSLLLKKQINELRWFYYEDFAKKVTSDAAIENMLNIFNDLKPDMIIFFHIGNFPVKINIIKEFKNINPKLLIIYDEGDMYGSWAKPLTKSIKNMMKFSDFVSIRGLGRFEEKVRKYNKNVFYTPHHNDIARYMSDPFILPENKQGIIFIGNRNKPRFLSNIRRLPGAKGREAFVRKMADHFPCDFKLYGNGWGGFKCNQGPVEFYSQNNYYQNALITVAYEHYPNVPFYFSNRLPMALMNGSLYVCHYHEGYEKIFSNCDFIYFFKSNSEAIDILYYLKSLSKSELVKHSNNARQFALRIFHPNVIWSNFLNNILKNAES